jgi:hypothetical protein
MIKNDKATNSMILSNINIENFIRYVRLNEVEKVKISILSMPDDFRISKEGL